MNLFWKSGLKLFPDPVSDVTYRSGFRCINYDPDGNIKDPDSVSIQHLSESIDSFNKPDPRKRTKWDP